jgi:FtsH-binding integral membrane protein
MIITAEIILAVAALVGLMLAVKHMRGNKPPLAVGLTHGLVGAVGLILLIVAMVQGTTGSAITIALVLLVISALGGFVLLSIRTRGKNLPRPLIAIHGLAAVAGYIVLLVGVR